MTALFSKAIVFIVTFASGWFVANSAFLVTPISAQSPNRKPVILPADNVPEDTKAAIIKSVLSTIDRRDDSVSEDGNLYLDVAETIFRMLPRRINGVPLRRFSSNTRNSRVYFPDWNRTGDTIIVTGISEFYGGNVGGCTYKFVLSLGRWKKQSVDCFAMAS